MFTAVLISKPKWFGLQIQVQHVLLSLLYAGIGAALGYLKAEPTLTLIAALSSWATAKPILVGAVMAFLVGLLGQAQKSLFGGTSAPPAAKRTVPYPGDSDPHVPPAAQRRYIDGAFMPLYCTPLALVSLVAACNLPPNISSQVQDGVTLEQCIQKDWGKPFLTVVADCLPGEEAVVADVIADTVIFLGSQSDGGPAVNPYASEPLVVAAIPRALERAKARK